MRTVNETFENIKFEHQVLVSTYFLYLIHYIIYDLLFVFFFYNFLSISSTASLPIVKSKFISIYNLLLLNRKKSKKLLIKINALIRDSKFFFLI
jgi:hypothetical protein